MATVATLSSGALYLLSVVFFVLGIAVCYDPCNVQKPHGLDLCETPASGLAEIRAFYLGTQLTLSWILFQAASSAAVAGRVHGLKVGGGVLGLFVLGRIFSYAVDGPPANPHAEIMWALEFIGTVSAFALWWYEAGRETTWAHGFVALAQSEPLTTPGEVVGNLSGAFIVYASYDGIPGLFDLRSLNAWSLTSLALLNVVRYSAAYWSTYHLFYSLKVGRASKFNASQYIADVDIFQRERRRWCIGVAIGTAYDCALRWAMLHHAGSFGTLLPLPASSMDTGRLVALAVGCIGFVDLHFYCVHRTLHTPLLYKHIHSSHHQSRNPNPISGLSLHPIESALYFSALPMALALAAFGGVQLHAFHYCVIKGILDFNPIWGHAGFGGAFGGSYHHYVHHTVGYKLHVNFGGTWLFDGLLGTGHVEPRPSQKKI